MATLQAAINEYAGLSEAFKNMNVSMKVVKRSFQEFETAAASSASVASFGADAIGTFEMASASAFDTAAASSYKEEVIDIGIQYDQMERSAASAKSCQIELNKAVEEGKSGASGFVDKIKGVASTISGAYSALQVNKIMEMADATTLTRQRLDQMNDGLQTTDQLQDKIFQAAQGAGVDYSVMAEQVANLGNVAGGAFSSSEEMVYFAREMNKQWRIGGASADDQAVGMDLMAQAMAGGVLEGDALNHVLQKAPLLAEAIAAQMGQPVESLQALASQGLITSEVVKNAMDASASEADTRFAELPVTFARVWIGIKNTAEKAFEPVLEKLASITGSSDFSQIIGVITGGLVMIGGLAAGILGVVANVAGFIVDNWSVIGPLVTGVAVALGLLYAATLLNNGIQMASSAVNGILTGATLAQISAQTGLNAAILACPITWIIVAVIALIAVFYGVIALINKFAGTSLSATGMIIGAFTTLGAVLINVLMGAWEQVAGYIEYGYNTGVAFANFFGNLFNDPVGAVIHLFADLADNVLGILEKIASGMDFIFGTNMADTIKGWRSDLDAMTEEAVTTFGNGQYEEVVSELDLDKTLGDLGIDLERIDYGEAFNAGNELGEIIDEKMDLANMFNSASEGLGSGLDMGNEGFEDLLSAYNGEGLADNDGTTIEDAQTAAAMRDSMDATDTDISYMRDVAEQEAVNRFTTAEIKIDMSGMTNQVNNEMDLDGVVTHLEETLYETMTTAAEGVHE